MFETIKTFIGQNWLSTTISLLAVFYAIYEARRRRGPMLAYQFTGQRLIGSNRDRLPGEVQISFKGNAVTNLSQSQIVVWNKGDAPLRASDIPAHDAVAFSFGDETKVLLAEVVKITRQVNKVEALYEAGEGNSITLKFDFLDKGDGALISVWHNGDDPMPDSHGTILGQKSGPVSYGRFVIRSRNYGPRRASKLSERLILPIFDNVLLSKIFDFFPAAMMLGGLFVTFLPLLDRVIPSLISESDNDTSPYVFVTLGMIYFLGGVFLYQLTRRRFPKELTPDEFLDNTPRPRDEAEVRAEQPAT